MGVKTVIIWDELGSIRETYLHHDEIERLLPTMACRAEVMRNRSGEIFYRFPALVGSGASLTWWLPAACAAPPACLDQAEIVLLVGDCRRGFLQRGDSLLSSCQWPRGWAGPSQPQHWGHWSLTELTNARLFQENQCSLRNHPNEKRSLLMSLPKFEFDFHVVSCPTRLSYFSIPKTEKYRIAMC